MQIFLSNVKELPRDLPILWMGAYLATYEIGDSVRKVAISFYGGFFYDENLKKHFELPESSRDEWQEYIADKAKYLFQ